MTNETYEDDRQSGEGGRSDISSFANSVLSVLSDKTDAVCQTVRASVVNRLVEASLAKGNFAAEALVHNLADARVNPDQMVDVYIPEAALQLGQMWVDDKISFAQVTIASARLQGLLTLLSPSWSARFCSQSRETQALLVLQAGDTHTLGPHVATAQLRRMGVSVRILFGTDAKTLLRTLADEPFDLVMFSTSRTEYLAPIAKLVKRIRAGLNDTPPLVLGGIVMSLTDRVKEKTGVDLVTADIKAALKLCERAKHKTRSMAQ